MQPSREKQLEMLRSMPFTRRFEDRLMELCQIQGKIPGMMTLCTGQEAVSPGVCAALREEAPFCLKAPFRRVTGPDIPVPFSPPLEQFYIPDERAVEKAVLEIAAIRRSAPE